MDLKEEASFPSELIVKADFSDSVVEFKLTKEEIKYENLLKSIKHMYKETPTNFTIKYRDNDGDLVTIGCDEDLKALFNWPNQNSNNKQHMVHLFIVSRSPKGDKTILHGITKMLVKLSLEDKIPDYSPNVLKGSEWSGECTYPSGDVFPLTLNITNVNAKERTIEGSIRWETLEAVTRILGLFGKSNKFKFTEYEAIRGSENVQLPTNYSVVIEQNTIRGEVLGEEKASISLHFIGINDKHEGYLEMLEKSANSAKRKFNLWTNNSLEGPTVEDTQGSFKKLVQNSVYWYDRNKLRGELQPIEEKKGKKHMRTSCAMCGLPTYEQPSATESGEKVIACSNYPFCKPNSTWYYDPDGDEDFWI